MEQSTADQTLEIAAEEPTPLSQLVIDAVADAEGLDPIELAPLYGAIDPDALDSLFDPQYAPDGLAPTGQVEFSYHGYEVRVTAAGRLELTEE